MQRNPAEGEVATPSSIELAILTLTITWLNCLAVVEGAAEGVSSDWYIVVLTRLYRH